MPDTASRTPSTLPERPWLASYPAGMPSEIGASPYTSLRDLFETACTKHADRPAYTCMGTTITFGALAQTAPRT